MEEFYSYTQSTHNVQETTHGGAPYGGYTGRLPYSAPSALPPAYGGTPYTAPYGTAAPYARPRFEEEEYRRDYHTYETTTAGPGFSPSYGRFSPPPPAPQSFSTAGRLSGGLGDTFASPSPAANLHSSLYGGLGGLPALEDDRLGLGGLSPRLSVGAGPALSGGYSPRPGAYSPPPRASLGHLPDLSPSYGNLSPSYGGASPRPGLNLPTGPSPSFSPLASHASGHLSPMAGVGLGGAGVSEYRSPDGTLYELHSPNRHEFHYHAPDGSEDVHETRVDLPNASEYFYKRTHRESTGSPLPFRAPSPAPLPAPATGLVPPPQSPMLPPAHHHFGGGAPVEEEFEEIIHTTTTTTTTYY